MNITNGWMPVAKMFWCVVGMICASSTNLWERSLGQDLPTWHHAAAAMHVSCAEEQVYQQWFFWILAIVRCVFFSCPWYYYSNIQTNKWWKGVIYTKLELETFFLFSVWVEELEQGKQKNKGLRAEIKKKRTHGSGPTVLFCPTPAYTFLANTRTALHFAACQWLRSFLISVVSKG